MEQEERLFVLLPGCMGKGGGRRDVEAGTGTRRKITSRWGGLLSKEEVPDGSYTHKCNLLDYHLHMCGCTFAL